MELTTDQEIELVKKYKEELICPICQRRLVNKDYLINKGTLIKLFIGFIIGIIIGGLLL